MKFIKLLVVLMLLSSCQKDKNTVIAKNQLGDLTNSTKIFQIEKLLAKDSVVTIHAMNAYGERILSTIKEIEVYDTSGQKMLLIKPSAAMDSLSLIKSIRILSDNYKTNNGLGIGSTFADLKAHHDIGNIQSSLKSVILTLEDINAFVSFDKSVLPGDVRFDREADIKPTMIPDDAQINRFWLNFDSSPYAEK